MDGSENESDSNSALGFLSSTSSKSNNSERKTGDQQDLLSDLSVPPENNSGGERKNENESNGSWHELLPCLKDENIQLSSDEDAVDSDNSEPERKRQRRGAISDVIVPWICSSSGWQPGYLAASNNNQDNNDIDNNETDPTNRPDDTNTSLVCSTFTTRTDPTDRRETPAWRFVRDLSDISSLSSFSISNEPSPSPSPQPPPHFEVEFEVASLNSFSSNPIEDANSSSGLDDVHEPGLDFLEERPLLSESSTDEMHNFADEEETEDSVLSNNQKGAGALSDSELSDKDLWFCSQCNAKTNNPYLRYCLRCFRIRRDWLPKRPNPKKARKRKIGNPDSRNRRHTSSEDEGIETKVEAVVERNEIQPVIANVPTDKNDGLSTAPNSSTTNSNATTTPSPLRDIDVVDSAVNAKSGEPSPPSSESKPNNQSATLQIFKDILSSEPIKVKSVRTVEESEPPMCGICMVRDKDSCFVHGKTAHMYSCYSCADKILKKNGKCPICRKRILRVVKVITS